MSAGYTPTTQEVKRGWLSNCAEFSHRDADDEKDYSEQFDRWLAAHDVEVRTDEREKVARESWWIDLDNGRDDRWVGPFPTFQLALWARSYLELQQTPRTFALVPRFAAARGDVTE